MVVEHAPGPDALHAAVANLLGALRIPATSEATDAHLPPAASASAPMHIGVASGNDDGADETGLEANDIYVVCSQVGVSRAEAIRALRSQNGDVVEAIMELTA